MTTKLCLVVIRSLDLEKSRRFYEALGLEFREERHGPGPLHLACKLPGIVFEIYPAASAEESTKSCRVGFRVIHIESVITSATNVGGIIVSAPKISPWGRRAVLRDPDGHAVELHE